MRVTRETVAKEAGVTANTVSCVLNNIRPVSKEVRERVLKAVEKLNYVADFTSRGMKGKRTKQIVVVVDDLTNPFYSSMVSEIERTFNQNGYFVSISSEHDIDRNVSTLLARRVDAVYFCSGVGVNQVGKLKRLTEEGVKILINPRIGFNGEKSTLDMATGRASKRAVEYFISKGHKKIVLLTTLAEKENFDDREEIFIKTMKENNLEPVVIRYNDKNNLPTLALGRELFSKFIESKIEATAIFAIDDLIAIGAMTEAKDRGYIIPKDYSFIGIDGIELSWFFRPQLTTFKCDMGRFSKNVFRLLTNQIENGVTEDYVMPLDFIEGESVAELNEVKDV